MWCLDLCSHPVTRTIKGKLADRFPTLARSSNCWQDWLCSPSLPHLRLSAAGDVLEDTQNMALVLILEFRPRLCSPHSNPSPPATWCQDQLFWDQTLMKSPIPAPCSCLSYQVSHGLFLCKHIDDFMLHSSLGDTSLHDVPVSLGCWKVEHVPVRREAPYLTGSFVLHGVMLVLLRDGQQDVTVTSVSAFIEMYFWRTSFHDYGGQQLQDTQGRWQTPRYWKLEFEGSSGNRASSEEFRTD